MKTNPLSLLIAASISAAFTSAKAADLYRSGTGTWDGTSSNWGTVTGGPYNTAAWTDGDSAFFEGTLGTVTLDSNFTADKVTIGATTPSATNYVIGATPGNNAITFTGTKTLTVNGVEATINTGIAGSPLLTYNNRSDNASDLILNPGSLTQNFSAINVVKAQFGGNTNTSLVLGGTSVGNSTGPISWSAGAHQLTIDRQGSGTWEVGSYSGGDVRIRSTGAGGTLTLNGTTIVSHEIDIEAGTLTGTGTIGVTRLGAEHVRVFAGAALAPGNGGIGTLTVQNDHFTWSSNDSTAGMLYELSVGDNSSDQLTITRAGLAANEGGFLKGTGSAFLFDFTGGKLGETYTLVNFDTTTFSVGDFAVGSGIGGNFTLNSTSLQFTAVPEPGSTALLGLGAIALLFRRRK
jgi:fibronectin-binding autotransporter adhesin